MTLPLHRAAQRAGSVLLQGPRGSGKTTLLRREFPGHTYVALDFPDARARARQDPHAFLARLRGPAIVDDVHRAPELVAYLREFPPRGHLLLATSRRIVLPFAETLELHPPTSAERRQRRPLPLAMLGRFLPAAAPLADPSPPWPVPRSFLECDVRDLVQVHDIGRFEAFLLAAQSQSGQILDQQALARQCGLSHRTVVRWLDVLDTCFLTLRLPPASLHLGRRVIRRPKLHFLNDGGFESLVVSELYRNACHAGETPDLRHWRDSNGFAIPLVVESEAATPVPVAIAANPTPAEVTRLRRWMVLAGVQQGAVIGRVEITGRAGAILRYGIDQL